MKINEQLKKHRTHHNLTQEDVAQKLHVTRATISSWETGRTFPDIEKLIYLSDLYGLSLDQLIREEPKIMENIQKERKSLRRWQLAGRSFLGIGVLTLIYLALWFGIVGSKNHNLDTLDGWQKTGDDYTYKDPRAMFNARKIPFPRFDAAGHIWVSGGLTVPNNRLSVMIREPKGKRIIVTWGEDILATIQDKKLRDYAYAVEISTTGDFVRGITYDFLDSNNDRTTIDKLDKIHHQLLEIHKSEVLANYELVLDQWQRVNNLD